MVLKFVTKPLYSVKVDCNFTKSSFRWDVLYSRRMKIPVSLFGTDGNFRRGAGAVRHDTSSDIGRSFCTRSKIHRRFRNICCREFSFWKISTIVQSNSNSANNPAKNEVQFSNFPNTSSPASICNTSRCPQPCESPLHPDVLLPTFWTSDSSMHRWSLLIVFARVFTEFCVFVEERRLLDRIKFTGNMLRFFVNGTEAMKQILDTGRRVAHTVSFLDVMPNGVAVEIRVLVEMLCEFVLLRIGQRRSLALIH